MVWQGWRVTADPADHVCQDWLPGLHIGMSRPLNRGVMELAFRVVFGDLNQMEDE